MAGFSEVLGIDPEMLAARLKFLSIRAQWHRKQADSEGRTLPGSPAMHLACAATLTRDAGSVALLMGNAEQARSEFAAAGDLRLQLGFFDGLYLLRLGEVASIFGGSVRDDAALWIERSLRGEPEREGLPPFAVAASRSPLQLVSLVQAADKAMPPFGEAVQLALRALRVYSAYPLGVTQIPVARYLDLLNGLRHGELGDGRRTLVAMTAWREETVAVAQLDRFHWRLAQKPADLIDLDMLSLGLAALMRDENLFEQVREIAGAFGPTARLPFDAARLLMRPPPTETTGAEIFSL